MAGGDIGGIFGWMLLPPFAAKCTLVAFHWILRRFSPHLVPHPNTAKHAQHQRLSYIFVILLYLGYTLWSTEKGLAPNYYTMFGLDPGSYAPQQLRSNFRRLSLVLHPDKNPGSEGLFIHVQGAYKVLADPIMRFVYDRAGEAAVACASCKSTGDFILAALPRRLGVYLVYILGSIGVQVFGIGVYGTYWRYLAIACFLALDVLMMTRLTEPAVIHVLHWVMPRRTSFEIAQVLQQVMMCFFIALNQIGPHFIPQEKNVSTVVLAKELLVGLEVTDKEIVGRGRRIVDMYKGTGLESELAADFGAEMKLGMTMGTSKSFRTEYTERMNDERQKTVKPAPQQ
ncbi:hypothetical protein GGF37_003626 [Kickxella alabastrina]|nr:hypothetical protein GGF37_003626 [Kickxella alabastrina]